MGENASMGRVGIMRQQSNRRQLATRQIHGVTCGSHSLPQKNGMIRGLTRIIAFLLCVLALPLATSEAVASQVTVPVTAHKGPALWKVSDKDTTIYLFGTIHFLPQNVEWYGGDIARALQESGELVTEFDAREAGRLAALMQETAFLPEGENFRDKLGKDDRLAFEGMLVSMGIPVDRYDRYKPWAAGLEVSVTMIRLAGFDPSQGVEKVVLDKAPAGIKRSALETIDYQMAIFSNLPEETQLAYFSQVIQSASSLRGSLDTMLAEWLKGDAKKLAKLINANDADPELYRRLLTDRNAAWAKWIDKRLEQPGTVFVAVGAGHLAGKDSVQDRLKRLGIRTKRIR